MAHVPSCSKILRNHRISGESEGVAISWYSVAKTAAPKASTAPLAPLVYEGGCPSAAQDRGEYAVGCCVYCNPSAKSQCGRTPPALRKMLRETPSGDRKNWKKKGNSAGWNFQILPKYSLFGGLGLKNCGIVQILLRFFVQSAVGVCLVCCGTLCYNMYEGMRF